MSAAIVTRAYNRDVLPVAILAGGLATRLGPLTATTPKALIPIRGEPFLAHQLRLLRRNGIERVVLCVGHLGERIRDFAGSGERFGVALEYSFDGDTLLGTAGALRRAAPLLGDAFFVLYGDSYLPCDYRPVERAFYAAGRPALMTVCRNLHRWDRSNVELREGRIAAYDKQHPTAAMQHIDYGLGVLARPALDEVPEDAPSDLAALYQRLVTRGELAACEVEGRFYEVGSREGIRDLEEWLTPTARAVFLDRDGVINEPVVREGKPYPPASLEELQLTAGVGPALARLKQHGFLLIVVTNQPDIARGSTSRVTVDDIHSVLARTLPIDDFFVCPHDDNDACACRKPLPGLLLEAAERHAIDLGASYLIGDRWRDVEAGAAAGCRTVWIDRQYRERAPRQAAWRRASSIAEAVDQVLAEEG